MNIPVRNQAQGTGVPVGQLPNPPKPASEPAAKPTAVLPDSVALNPSDVKIVVESSELAKGSSLSHVALVDVVGEADAKAILAPETVGEEIVVTATYQRPDLSQVKPRAVSSEEMESLLDNYNDNVKSKLTGAKDGSLLDRFETSLRLMSMLNSPRLKEDPEAYDILQMRRAEVESEYKTLMQEPEVKAAFETAQKDALKEVFGDDLRFRSYQQAAYLLSNSFQEELKATPPAGIQDKIQKELSALSLLNPRLAKNIADDLIEKTLRSQALRMIQSNSEEGEQARESLGEALGVYLKAQQSAAGIGLQANNLTRLSSLSDDRIKELTQAVAALADGTEAADYNELAHSLMKKVDQLPADIQEDATRFLGHMQTQNVLGTVLLAGSIVGLTQREMPQDPKAWISLTTASVGTASMSHFALRLAGLDDAADLVSKVHYKMPVGALKVPVLSSVLTGVNITMDSMALYDEFHNEDIAGITSRAMGVGAGVASIAAATVLSGPAAPITLIGATVVGLAAWGVDAAWGESDLSGQIRQDLRNLGVSSKEETTAAQYNRISQMVNAAGWPGMGDIPFERPASREELKTNLANASLEDRVAVINQLIDQYTDGYEEKQLLDTAMEVSDKDFIALMNTVNTGRLIEELESPADRKAVLDRIQSLSDQGIEKPHRILVRLARLEDTQHLNAMWEKATPETRAKISSADYQSMLNHLTEGWGTSDENKATAMMLLQDEASVGNLQKVMAQPEGVQWFNTVRQEFSTEDQAKLLNHLSKHDTLQGNFESLFTPPESKGQSARRGPVLLTRLGHNPQAGDLTRELVSQMSPDELRRLKPETRETMKRLLEQTQRQQLWGGDSFQAAIDKLP
jgi:hypothetical protein